MKHIVLHVKLLVGYQSAISPFLGGACRCVHDTEWRRPIGCLELQVTFRKRATNYRSLLRKITYKDKASYGSSLPCMYIAYTCTFHIHVHFIYMYISYTCTPHIRLFCKRALKKRLYSAKETSHFKEPTNRSHPIHVYLCTFNWDQTYMFSSWIFRFFRLWRPPKGWQNRQTEKAKGSKIIPKILQKREILAGVQLNMCTWKLHTQWTTKINPNINIQFDRTICVLRITMNFIKLTQMTQRHLIQSCCFCRLN